MLTSVTKTGMDDLDLLQDSFEYFWMEQRLHTQDVTYLIKIMFNIVNAEATVNAIDIKK